MSDLTRNALLRNLAQAERLGQEARATRIRRKLARYGFPVPKAPKPEEAQVAPAVEEAAVGEPVAEEPTVEAEADVTLPFASPRAAELAGELGVGADAFDFEPSGQTGYTAADVRRAAEE
jgi:pyruvate/2-oxoglutarate dehydrogenase complex dihydrolipoamide acyltransferase (E2) component